MKKYAAAVVLACSLYGPAAAQSPAASGVPNPGPTGVAALNAFVGQWTCVVPKSSKASIWTIAYEEDGQVLHIAVAGPSAGAGVARRDVFIVAHPPANDLYAFGVGSAGWDFSRSAAFDGKTLSFASLQSADGRPVTETLELETALSFDARADSVLASGQAVSTTDNCTKA